MSSANRANDQFRLRLHDNVPIDICGNVPALAKGIVTHLEDEGFHFNGSAPTKVILDIPQGYALSVLEDMGRLYEDRSCLRSVVVTFNSCPEYLEDLWDLRPTVLLATPNYEHDLPHAIASASKGIVQRIISGQTTPLTRTERQVLRYLAQGWSNKAIAVQLNIQDKTVMNTLTAIYHKLHLKNRKEAALYYWGLRHVLRDHHNLVQTTWSPTLLRR